MTVDPSDPDTFEEATEAPEVDVEAPEADTAEQHADITPRRDDLMRHIHPDSADEADLAEQARVVELDEDDYR
ncbi:hypothetical protein ACH427_17500 [Streptomyces sp. NPDC020379]|uniref:hypothetical protein n=1 Tax=Streptomyces sp. NPDC020379 TaxID=3365071 RepID=UPI0037B0FD88